MLGSVVQNAVSLKTAIASLDHIVAGDVSFEQLAKSLHKKGSENGKKGNTLGLAAHDKSGHISLFSFDRRPLRDDDICIQITHCGICHSDLH